MPFLTFGTTEPIAWEVAFGTSCLPGDALLVIRWIFAAIFVCNFLLSFYRFAIEGEQGIWYFILLTNLGYLFETAYACILPLATMRAQAALREGQELQAGRALHSCDMVPLVAPGDELRGARAQAPLAVLRPSGTSSQPPLITASVALFSIAHPASLLVAILFWGLLQPVQDLCIFNGGEEPCDTVTRLDTYLHLTDWILLLVMFFIGRIPFYLQNSLYFVAFTFGYAVFTVLHYLLGIGVAPAQNCPEYPRRECPIYDVLDYHFPRQAFTLVGQVVFILVPVLIGLYWVLGWSRVKCCGCI